MPHHNRSIKAFTLIEAVIASVIVLIMGVSVIATIMHSFHQKRFERERAVALNRATLKIEELKRELFPAVRSSTENINLDINNTPNNASDDINATLVVELFHVESDGTKRAINTTSATTDLGNNNIDRDVDDVVEIRVSVNWTSREKSRSQVINTKLAP